MAAPGDDDGGWRETVRAQPWGPPPALRPLKPGAAAELADVYRGVEAALASAAPHCKTCGECCRFGPDRPVLFASALELAYLVSAGGAPPAAGAVPPGEPDTPWRCPYQAGDLCAAREARTLGCRTYFCRADARQEGERAYADAIRRIREVSDAAWHPWWYGPARLFFEAAAGR